MTEPVSELRTALALVVRFSEALKAVPDETPDKAYLGVDMTHGEARELRAAIATLAGPGEAGDVVCDGCNEPLAWCACDLPAPPTPGPLGAPIPEPVASAKLGLYRVHWASGGSSLAAIGMNTDGSRWLAPTNWIRPAVEAGPSPWWFEIDRLEMIASASPADQSWR